MKTSFLITTFTILIGLCTAHGQAKLNSYPAAAATIYLDFDGEEVSSPVWNNGNTLHCAAAALSNAQINEVFNRVAEDYRPFNINITTDINVFIAAPVDRRIRVIVTPTSGWFSGVGGVSYLGTFTWGDDTPCFVFCDRLGPNNAKMVAECCSHESGHSLGLKHQSKYDESCNLTATYNEGEGNGETGWAPIMGNSYYRNMSGWSNGPTPYGCGNTQDNLSVITSQNGFGYRTDDYVDDINTAPFVIGSSNINLDGLISTSTDKDAFKFSLAQNSNFHLDAIPFSSNTGNEGADLDIRLTLYDASKNLVRIYNPAASMGAVIDTILTAGNYYLVVDGTGNNSASDYGSLGSYTLKGIFGVLPVCNIKLTGNTVNSKHNLNWNISCNESISSIVLQTSTDGSYFTDITALEERQQSFSYVPYQAADLYYRMEVISLSGRTTYSAMIQLKKLSQKAGFTVLTVAGNEIAVTANDPYQYYLTDIDGRKLGSGAGVAGLNRISIQNKPPGIYILRLLGCGLQQTVRVLKQ